jgi:hypothetical protein
MTSPHDKLDNANERGVVERARHKCHQNIRVFDDESDDLLIIVVCPDRYGGPHSSISSRSYFLPPKASFCFHLANGPVGDTQQFNYEIATGLTG